MPKNLVNAFIGALSKLTKYRIYWRIGTKMSLEGIDIDRLPAHINITTYVPQNDLLAHRRCKLFITNGGSSSIMESLSYGVPVLGMPLYGVNYQNMVKVQQKGLGEIVNKDGLTEEVLLKNIKKLLENPLYKKTAEEVSK